MYARMFLFYIMQENAQGVHCSMEVFSNNPHYTQDSR